MLRLEAITKVFGGITALEDVSFTVREKTITGVIGPNGAGKTTLFNVVTGLYEQTAGDVYLENRKISKYAPEKLAGLGLVRTFQNVELFGQMSVLENVMVGLHKKSSSGIISCAFKLPGHIREERLIREKSMHWLEFTGMTDVAGVQARNLPFGKGRFLEIARALAAEPKVVLMDEPAAGLNSRETIGLASLIRKIRELGITVILVEHDMELIMDICETIVVLNLGRTLAEGTPREIQENRDVVSAYLGEAS
jgi:ABC-type branched-subunit amino acid transport system ATPase component